MTCVLLSQMILLGFSSGNALAFGRYCLFASGSSVADGWQARGIAIGCITFAVLLHSTLPKWGIRLFNVLGVFKVFILLFIVFAGFAALAGHRNVPNPHNFDNAFRLEVTENYGGGGAYSYAQALLRIIYSYVCDLSLTRFLMLTMVQKGWENANYVLGEVKNPRKTLLIAAPLAIGGTTILYVLANVAYFAAVSKDELATSEVLVAGVFFRNVFGNSAGARALPAFVALSNMGNVLAVSFAHSRLNQEFAKEGLLPFSRFWASNKPFNAPATAVSNTHDLVALQTDSQQLFLHWLVTVIVLVAPPAGPAYNFITDLYTYPGAWINGFVAAGLLYLRFTASEGWTSPFKSWIPVIVLYLLANIFLAIVPFIPPEGGDLSPDGYPFYVFPVVGVGVLIAGAVYWLLWKRVWPSIHGYSIQTEHYISEDGREVVRYVKLPNTRKDL